MMMVIRKKQLVIAALAIVIGTAGYVNARKTGADADVSSDSPYLGEAQLVDSGSAKESVQNDFFTQARLDREAGRSRSIETFNSIISNNEADEAAKASAQQGVLQLAQNTETETAIENLLRARGFADAVCYINNGMASIVVKAKSLDSADSAKITEIVTEQSGIPNDKVKIMEMN